MIPKVVHHIAPYDVSLWHPVWDKSFPTWLEHFPRPEYRHRFWNDGYMIDGIVREEFPNQYQYYEKARHIMKIDIAKMVILYVHGGLYKDMDYYCYGNFHDDLNNNVCLTGSTHSGELLQNGMVATTPEHPFIKSHIDKMFNRLKSSWDDGTDDYVKNNTGPMALSRDYNHMSHLHDEIKILNPEIYNPNVDRFYKNRTDDKVKCIHLLSGIWGRKDLRSKEDMTHRYEGWRGIKIDDL